MGLPGFANGTSCWLATVELKSFVRNAITDTIQAVSEAQALECSTCACINPCPPIGTDDSPHPATTFWLVLEMGGFGIGPELARLSVRASRF